MGLETTLPTDLHGQVYRGPKNARSAAFHVLLDADTTVIFDADDEPLPRELVLPRVHGAYVRQLQAHGYVEAAEALRLAPTREQLEQLASEA